MLHIILLIFKIAGIILLILLGILLLALCAVLFVPVTWKARAEKKDMVRVKASVGWLFWILSVHYMMDMDGEFRQKLQVRLFGIPILRILGEDKPKKSKKEKRRKRPLNTDEPIEAPGSITEEPPKAPEPITAESSKAPGMSGREEPDTDTEQERSYGYEQKMAGNEPKKKRSMLEKIRGIFSRIICAIRSVCDKIKRIGEKIRHIKDSALESLDKKDMFLEFWRLETHVRARAAIWREIRYLWKHARPKRLEGYVRFGFSDPSVTGICMGTASMLYAWYPEKFSLDPDFEQEILEGELLIKGHIRGIVILCIALRTLCNKDIRHMYRDGKQLIGGSS